MNIRDHIEAGHYPKDDKGRALVPVRDGTMVYTILCTDRPGSEPIVGFCAAITNSWQCWPEDGSCEHGLSLLPPPPRKVEVKRWAVIRRNDGSVANWWDSEADAKCAVMDRPDAQNRIIIQMTGSYEEPWIK